MFFQGGHGGNAEESLELLVGEARVHALCVRVPVTVGWADSGRSSGGSASGSSPDRRCRSLDLVQTQLRHNEVHEVAEHREADDNAHHHDKAGSLEFYQGTDTEGVGFALAALFGGIFALAVGGTQFRLGDGEHLVASGILDRIADVAGEHCLFVSLVKYGVVASMGFHNLINHGIVHVGHGELGLHLGGIGSLHQGELFVELALHLCRRFACHKRRLFSRFNGCCDCCILRCRIHNLGRGISCELFCFVH